MADTLGPMVGNVVGISIVSVHLDDFAAFWLVFSVAGIGVVTFMWWGEPRQFCAASCQQSESCQRQNGRSFQQLSVRSEIPS